MLAPITISGSPEVTIRVPDCQETESDASDARPGSVPQGSLLLGETGPDSRKGHKGGVPESKQRSIPITLSTDCVFLVSGRCLIDLPERTETACAVFAIWREPI